MYFEKRSFFISLLDLDRLYKDNKVVKINDLKILELIEIQKLKKIVF